MVIKSKRAFRTISEAADDLDVPQHVLRFWETRFTAIKPMKRGGNRRFYRPSDIHLLKAIKHHLYDLDKSIKEVQTLIKKSGVKTFVDNWKSAAGFVEKAAPAPEPAPKPEKAPVAPPPQPEDPSFPEEPGLTFEPEAEAEAKTTPEVEPAAKPAPQAPDEDDSVKVSKDLVRALVNDLKALRALIDRLP